MNKLNENLLNFLSSLRVRDCDKWLRIGVCIRITIGIGIDTNQH